MHTHMRLYYKVVSQENHTTATAKMQVQKKNDTAGSLCPCGISFAVFLVRPHKTEKNA